MRAVEKYLQYVQRQLLERTRTIRFVNGGQPDGFMDRFHDLLPVARVFDVDGPSFEAVHSVVAQSSCDSFDEANPDSWAQSWENAREEVPFPALPFPVVWVGFSPSCEWLFHRVNITIPLMQRRGLLPEGRLLASELIGVLMAEVDEDSGFAAAVFAEQLDTLPGSVLYSCTPICDPKLGWLNATSGEWYCVARLGAHIASAAVEEKPVSAAMRLAYRKSGVPQWKVPPQPWYRVHGAVSSTFEMKRDFAGTVGRMLSFRHDRAAHDRLYVQRGVGIPSRETIERLVDRGYQVWMGSIDDERVLALMSVRGHAARRDDEWLATKVVRIEATVVGDESLPYMPGVRSR